MVENYFYGYVKKYENLLLIFFSNICEFRYCTSNLIWKLNIKWGRFLSKNIGTNY